ncbi:hypothetical protein HK097_003277, partial [Rhizophlyctis rosea]
MGTAPLLTPNSDTPATLTCSICTSLIFRPRLYVHPNNHPCTHTYCLTCLHLFKSRRQAKAKAPQLNKSSTENLIEDLKAGVEAIQCPLCPDDSSPGWTNNPLTESDETAEQVLEK